MRTFHFAAIVAATTLAVSAFAQAPAAKGTSATRPAQPTRPCTSLTVDPPTVLTMGKSSVIRVSAPVRRIIVGGRGASQAGRPVAVNPAPGGGAPAGVPPASQPASDGVADTEIMLLSPTELFFQGRQAGSMNVVLQSDDGSCIVKDIVVTIDPGALQAKLGELLPEESGIKVRGADTALVLTGSVSDAVKLEQVLSLAASYGDPKKLVNLMRVTAPQQVMLEVKIAEVSKNLLDRLGSAFAITRTTSGGNNTLSVISNFLSGGGGLVQALRKGHTALTLDAQANDGIVRVLAEPNIMAISGQSASFLSGGKIFIPVAQSNNGGTGGTTITLEEKEFGVGLKFTPTVLDGRVNLKVISEVSELSQTGTPFTTVGGITAVLPSMTTRRVDTTVQLGDGQSFVVAGLIKNNVTEALNRFPGLGEVPVMGALFRSTEFQADQTELMFVVTPRLVKPLTATVTLPTDNHIVPTRAEVMLMGRTEGAAPAATRPSAGAQAPATVPATGPATPVSSQIFDDDGTATRPPRRRDCPRVQSLRLCSTGTGSRLGARTGATPAATPAPVQTSTVVPVPVLAVEPSEAPSSAPAPEPGTPAAAASVESVVLSVVPETGTASAAAITPAPGGQRVRPARSLLQPLIRLPISGEHHAQGPRPLRAAARRLRRVHLAELRHALR